MRALSPASAACIGQSAALSRQVGVKPTHLQGELKIRLHDARVAILDSEQSEALQGANMKLAFFDDFKLGVVVGDKIVDVSAWPKASRRSGRRTSSAA